MHSIDFSDTDSVVLTKFTFWDHIRAWQQGVFYEKIEIKLPGSIMFLKEWTFYLTKWGHKSSVFQKNERFWQKWDEQCLFRKKSKNNGILLPILHNIVYLWHNWSFGTKYGHENRGFFIKKWKKLHESTVFFENGRVFDKIWAWEQCVFREWTFFWQKMGMRAVIFREK